MPAHASPPARGRGRGSAAGAPRRTTIAACCVAILAACAATPAAAAAASASAAVEPPRRPRAPPPPPPIDAIGDDVPAWTPTTVTASAAADDDADGDRRRRERALSRALARDGVAGVLVPGLGDAKKRAAALFAPCVAASPNAQVETYEDGADRHTLATTTRGAAAGVVGEKIDHGAVDVCARFEAVSSELRSLVSVAAALVARAMSVGDFAKLIDGRDAVMLRAASASAAAGGRDGDGDGDGGPSKYASVGDILDGGTHLEHFHAYRSSPSSRASASEEEATTKKKTIELHTDHGLFIAFTPAVVVSDGRGDDAPGTVDAESSPGEFEMSLPPNGRRVRLDHENLDDDVVIVALGDMMEHQIGEKLESGLRAVPHAVTMPALGDGRSRFWYGRMFLPPRDALMDEARGVSFGELRDALVADARSGGGGGGGRKLLAAQCNVSAPEIYCWMRCMSTSALTCASGQHEQCVNTRGQIWTDANGHGDFYPECVSTANNNTTKPITDPPKIPATARCTESSFYDAVDVPSYANSLELVRDKLYLMWDVLPSGRWRARMAFNGVVGYLAVGLKSKNPAAAHNGMNDAPVIMGVNDPYADANDPNVFGSPVVGTGVKGYHIHATGSAFRHWYGTGAAVDYASAMTVTSCHSYMDFTTTKLCHTAVVFGAPTKVCVPLNFGGENEMMWAVHDDTFLKGYHSMRGFGRKDSRDFFTLDLSKTYGHRTCNYTAGWNAANKACTFGVNERFGSTDDDGSSDVVTATQLLILVSVLFALMLCTWACYLCDRRFTHRRRYERLRNLAFADPTSASVVEITRPSAPEKPKPPPPPPPPAVAVDVRNPFGRMIDERECERAEFARTVADAVTAALASNRAPHAHAPRSESPELPPPPPPREYGGGLPPLAPSGETVALSPPSSPTPTRAGGKKNRFGGANPFDGGAER